MKQLVPILLGICSLHAAAQNHVPNGSFEAFMPCPNNISQANRCVGWSQYHGGTSDYYNSCAPPGNVSVPLNWGGWQLAAQGDAYMGVISYFPTDNYKEYIVSQITPLQIGTTYEVSMSVNIPNRVGWFANDLGVRFYDQLPPGGTGYPCLTVTPHVSYASSGILTDTANWVRLIRTFVADSAYDNILIGGFTPNSSLTVTQAFTGPGGMYYYAYYYIDSVVVRPVFQLNPGTVYCAGDVVNISYTVPGSYYFTGNIFTVQLSNAAGSFAAPVNIGSVAATSSGTIQVTIPAGASGTGYRMRVITTNPADTIGDNGQNITIKPKPVLLAASNSPVCSGASLSVTATATTGSSFSWTGPASFSSSQANNVIPNSNSTHSGDYIVTASLNGCTSKDTVTVLIKPLPAAPTAGNSGPVCSGVPLSLTSNSTTAGVTYSWTGPGGYNSALQNPTIASTTTADAGVYNVTATLNGCNSAPGSTTVQIYSTPPAPVAGSNSPVCAGGTLNLTASPMAGANYSWSGPAGFSSTAQNPVINPVPVNGAGTYNVTATLNGCVSAAGSTTVAVNNVSSLGAYTSPNDTLCANNANATFVAVSFNAGASPQYQWFKNNNLIGGATNITYPASNIADGDSFYCRMTATGLCSETLILYSSKIGMTVLPVAPGPSVTITADPGTLLSPWQLVKFTAVATNAGPMPKYQWKRNSQDVIGANGNIWSANNLLNGDTIGCVVTSNVWCASPSNAASNRVVVNIKTGITDIDADRKLELYPNPNNGSFVIHLPPAFILRSNTASLTPSGGGQVRVDVIDAVGRIIFTDHQSPITNSKIEVVLPGSVANGVYLLKLMVDDAVYHTRFTVDR